MYHYTSRIVLAVRVALATGRPLLVRGPSGGGKSSLARHVARVLEADYVDQVITSRTQAQDLLWTVDHIRRLRDAHANQLRLIEEYVLPGVLWRAFDPVSAARQAARAAETRPAGTAPVHSTDLSPPRRAVVLLDEIDKADPDVPNNLLVALGSLEFLVHDTGETVRADPRGTPLVILTTNNERDLPAAFLRRCVELDLPVPDGARLVTIGRLHFEADLNPTVEAIAGLLVPGPPQADQPGSAVVSIAEFLDCVRACRELGVTPGSAEWREVVEMTVWKHGRAPSQG
ncbi:MAG TPA: MoxR family ATPase [Longimicrobium sp.]|nr:MoxR family ATPase [Longimicrobium sp.]